MSWLGAHRWDALLVIVVGIQATVLAYLHRPRLKAVVLALPIPFTLLSLTVGRPVDATNMLGLALLLGSTLAVTFLHYRMRVPILPAIAAAFLAHCLAGFLLFPVVPATGGVFWLAALGTAVLGSALYATMPYREEPGHRSPLPVWIKLPALTAVVLILVSLKRALGGFATTAPLVMVIAWYEGKRSLWTICRKMPVIMLCFTAMIGCVRLAQERLGLGAALLLGWAAYLAAFIPLTLAMWRRDDRPAPPAAEPASRGRNEHDSPWRNKVK